MARCPDCDRVAILSYPERGNGKCSHCNGDGKSISSGLNEAIFDTPLYCWCCGGSGDCQTCGGTGTVDSDEDDKDYSSAQESEYEQPSTQSSNSSDTYYNSNNDETDSDTSYYGGGGSTYGASDGHADTMNGCLLVFVVLFCFFLVIYLIGYILTGGWHTNKASTANVIQGKVVDQQMIHIGQKAIWQPSRDTIDSMRDQCNGNQYPNFDECLVSKMRDLGAPSEAVAFTTYLLKENYPFCFVRSFHPLGHVDMAEIDCPIMANTMGYTFLVNGRPSLVRVGDPRYLNTLNLANHPRYPAIKQKFREAELWSSSADCFSEMQSLPDGGQRFVFTHVLLNGCRGCEIAGAASIGYDFDTNGTFTGVILLDLASESEFLPLSEHLKNAEYFIVRWNTADELEKKVKLLNGEYSTGGPIGSAEYESIWTGQMAYGDLNDDGKTDAAVILFHNTGGSGTVVQIAAVLDVDGQTRHVASRNLGDRTEIKSLVINNGVIAIRLDNPRFFPGQEKTIEYTLENNKLLGPEPFN